MKCLSRLLFNVYADEREECSSVRGQQRQRRLTSATEDNKTVDSNEFDRAPAGAAKFQALEAAKATLSGGSCMRRTDSVLGQTNENADLSLIEDSLDDDWILLEHEYELQIGQHSETLSIESSSAALLSQPSEGERKEELPVCDHHCHCQRHCGDQLRKTRFKQTSTSISKKAQHCRPTNDTLVDCSVYSQAVPSVSAQIDCGLKPVQQETQIDQKEIPNQSGDLRNQSSDYINHLYRIGFKSQLSLGTNQTSVNLPRRTTATTTTTTIVSTNNVTMDNTDIELIKASWSPARKDPVAAGALLFKGLFTKFPQYLKLFAQFSDLDLDHIQENKKLLKHALKVIDTVTYVVDAVGDDRQSGQLNQALTDLVNNHLKRKIGLTEFRNLGIVLIDFVCDFNNSHNNELRIDTNLVSAWTKLYGSVLELVKRLENQLLDDAGGDQNQNLNQHQSQPKQTERSQQH